jgi:hypothetical protein
MRRTAQYYNMFEGIRIPSLPASVNATFQRVKAVVAGAQMWISKFEGWSNHFANTRSPDIIEGSGSDSDSVRYVPLCSCRVRKLDYAKIINETDGPHYDADVFKELKEAYWRGRSQFLRRILKIWVFDLREVRPVEVVSEFK